MNRKKALTSLITDLLSRVFIAWCVLSRIGEEGVCVCVGGGGGGEWRGSTQPALILIFSNKSSFQSSVVKPCDFLKKKIIISEHFNFDDSVVWSRDLAFLCNRPFLCDFFTFWSNFLKLKFLLFIRVFVCGIHEV